MEHGRASTTQADLTGILPAAGFLLHIGLNDIKNRGYRVN